MSKTIRYKCDCCGGEFDSESGGIHLRGEMRQDSIYHTTGIIGAELKDGPFDFCKKDCLLDFFARYDFR